MKTSLRSSSFFWSRWLAIASFWSLSGCLLISGRPILDFGATCKANEDCASFGFCGQHPTYGPVCLPQSAECTQVNDAICGGYACELKYGASNAYCERNCRATADCASTHDCRNFDDQGTGECLPR